MNNIFDKLDYTENGFVIEKQYDEARKEALNEYIEESVKDMATFTMKKEAAEFLNAYTHGANDVLNAATTVFHQLFKRMLTDGLKEGTDEYVNMEADALRHTKDFYNMIVELTKIYTI